MISSLLRAASIWRAISCSVLTLPVKLSGGTIDGPLSAGASSFAAAIPASGRRWRPSTRRHSGWRWR